MSRRIFTQKNRGTTLLEILVAVALLLIIFLFITMDLIQSSDAENVAATRSESMDAANYLLGVMQNDPAFWSKDWFSGPYSGTAKDPCGNPYPAYTDSILAPTWHPAPACTPSGSNQGLFPDLVGAPVFQYMWNAQQPGTDAAVANLTVWVQIQEGGRPNIYELDSTRTNIQPPPSGQGILPTPTPTPGPSSSACSGVCSTSSPTIPPSPTPKPSHTPTPTPTPTPSKPPTPTPSPIGTFE